MIVRQTTAIVLVLIASFTLTACSTASPQQPAVLAAPALQEEIPATPTSTAIATITVAESQSVAEPQFWVEQATRTDDQGAVVVEITPLNLNNPGQTLDFQVSMNTHSVDLAMDLAALATLTTDTGYTVQADGWDAPSGGHHVSGKLSFPAVVDNAPLLTGATKLVLTVVNLGASERVFAWEQ